nr:immunoglobulin heavy chain junction region [Macaca mulatta]MOV52716.1 immunoglobulin heavy chain junction region [Macaca mulatta]
CVRWTTADFDYW